MGFPKKFLWGVSVSGFQFEMGNSANKNVDANTDWHVWVHDAQNIKRGLVSGDLPENGVDYWSLYEKDHDLSKSLGLNAYRVGVEWSRIFPKSTKAIEVGVEVASDGNFSKIVQNYGFACQPNSKSADGMPTSDLGWEIFPEGMLEALKMMEKYECPLYVTENGIGDEKDELRPKFIVDHLKMLEKALDEKIDVRGYFHWSLTDNYEWARGFKMKFGLFAVDLKTKKRIMRKSAKAYKKIIEG